MGDLVEHEDELRRVLRRLEPHTPFAEVMGQQIHGQSVSCDRISHRAHTAPRLSGAVVRAWTGDHWTEAAASGFDRASLDAAGDALVRSLSKKGARVPPPGVPSTTVGRSTARPARPMSDLGLEDELEYVRTLYRWASEVPGIQNVSTMLNWWDDERLYLNSAGANCSQVVCRVNPGYVPVATENGRSALEHDQAGGIGGQEILGSLTEERVREYALGAVALLSAKEPPAGFMNVVLDPGVTGVFAHESFGHGAEADQFSRDRSYLRPLLGEVVGPTSLTIVDDGSIPGAWGSIFFDDEGHPGAKTPLIEQGRFVGALHDRVSAGEFSARPTGNTRRCDFLGRTFVRMTNTFVEPQDWTLPELLEEAGDGVLLEHWDSGVEDPLGGQMQLKVRKGRRIEHGELTDLVSSMALSGGVLDFLKGIRGVGDRTGFHIGAGFCGKGHGDSLPTGDGGPYLLSQAIVGPA